MNLSDLTLDALALELKDARQQWYEQFDRAVEIAEEMSRRTGTPMIVTSFDAEPWSRKAAERNHQ